MSRLLYTQCICAKCPAFFFVSGQFFYVRGEKRGGDSLATCRNVLLSLHYTGHAVGSIVQSPCRIVKNIFRKDIWKNVPSRVDEI